MEPAEDEQIEPTQWETYKVAEICAALRATGGLIATAARQLGCDPKTIRNYRDKYAAVRKVIEFESDLSLDKGETRLMNMVNAPSHPDHFKAVRMLLRTKGRNRGYVERNELTGKDGEGITIDFVPAKGKQ